MTAYRSCLKESMEIIAEGTSMAMRRLLPEGAKGYLGRMNAWTGRYTLVDQYVPFFPGYLLGRLWLLHLYTGKEEYKAWALRVLTPMIQDLAERPVPSQASGLDLYYGLCWAADITGSEELKTHATKATDNMFQGLWSDRAGVFLMGPGRSSVNIDAAACLFAVPWAARYDAWFMEYWTRHNDTIAQLGFVRPDGSTFQVGHFDDDGHDFRYFTTFQGWRPESTWARGQSWAIQNYTAAYEATGLERFLDVAVATADWWVEHAPSDWVPYYDFDDPGRNALPRDSCAAAITANALVRLAKMRPDLAAKYRPVAEGTLQELASNYLSGGGMLLHGSFGNITKPGSLTVRFPQEEFVPFGNYYFVEALYRELKPDWSLFRLSA